MTTAKTHSKTIGILGCGGFIGSHLTERILSTTTWRIHGVDRQASKISSLLDNPAFTFVNADVDTPGVMQRLIDDSDIVISLVALCNPAQYNTIPIEVIKSNFTQPMAVVERCAQRKKWLIHFSTCEVYGTTVSHAAGTAFNPATDIFSEETTPLVLGPIHAQRWTYACAKQLLERAIYAHGFERGLPFTIIRPFNFIGPRMDFIPGIDGEGIPRVLACFMDALLTNQPLKLVDGGHRYRAFTAIEDAIDAVMAILNRPAAAQGQIFNIGNPANEVTIAELASLMIELYRQLRPEFDKRMFATRVVPAEEFYGPGYEDSDRRLPDIAKARALLDWSPRTPLADALKKTMAFYIREYGHLPLQSEAI